jgi:hypothetical protein
VKEEVLDNSCGDMTDYLHKPKYSTPSERTLPFTKKLIKASREKRKRVKKSRRSVLSESISVILQNQKTVLEKKCHTKHAKKIIEEIRRPSKKNANKKYEIENPEAPPNTNPKVTRGTSANAEKRSWFDRCLYKCRSCSLTFPDSRAAGCHTRRYKHNRSAAISVPEYKCKICSKYITWCWTYIQQHIHRNHSICMEEYGEEYEGQLKEPKTVLIRLSLNKQAQLDEEPLVKGRSPKEETQYKCPNRNPIDQPKRGTPIALANEEALVNKYCSVSKELQANKASKSVEKKSTLKPGSNWYDKKSKGRGRTDIPRYVCKICSTDIAWSKRSIRLHLARMHKRLSLEEYGKEYEVVSSPSTDVLINPKAQMLTDLSKDDEDLISEEEERASDIN